MFCLQQKHRLIYAVFNASPYMQTIIPHLSVTLRMQICLLILYQNKLLFTIRSTGPFSEPVLLILYFSFCSLMILTVNQNPFYCISMKIINRNGYCCNITAHNCCWSCYAFINFSIFYLKCIFI